MVDMVNRELTTREREIYEMIPDEDNVTFGSIVDLVRRDTNVSRFRARRKLKHLRNK